MGRRLIGRIVSPIAGARKSLFVGSISSAQGQPVDHSANSLAECRDRRGRLQDQLVAAWAPFTEGKALLLDVDVTTMSARKG
jgi:hypothetical protein